MSKMAPPTVYLTQNATVEYYLWLIVIKLALLSAFKIVRTIVRIHSAYRKSIKKKYSGNDIEAPKPQPPPRT